MSKLKFFIYPLVALSGTIIGVGLFALPYIASKVGIWVMLGYFLVLGILVTLVHLFFSELSLKTPDFKRLPGFAKIYLGVWGEKIAFISTILGLFGAILAYLIVGGEFLRELLSPLFGGNSLFYTFLYFSLGAVLIFAGIKAISKIEFLGLILFFSVLLVIFFWAKPFLKINNLFIQPDMSYFFLPYGATLFSLWGAALIPEAEEMLGERKKLLKTVIILATLIPIFVYLGFIYLILGVTGAHTTESAITGLRDFLGGKIVTLGLIFGILTTFTSFIALGLTLRNVFWYDLKIRKNIAFVITCFIPLTFFLIGVKQFIPVISFVGATMLGIDGILILLMYQKVTKKKFVYPLALIFLAGILYEIIYFVK
jgi:tyrosine-specific transport protein